MIYILIAIVVLVAIVIATGLLRVAMRGPTEMYQNERDKYQYRVKRSIRNALGGWYGFLALTLFASPPTGIFAINVWLDIVLLVVLPYVAVFFYTWGFYLNVKPNANEPFIPMPTLRRRMHTFTNRTPEQVKADVAMRRFDKIKSEGRAQKRRDDWIRSVKGKPF